MTPVTIEELAQRLDRLLLRHEELRRTQALLQQEVRRLTLERDQLHAQCAAARQRLDALIARLSSAEDEP
jgi:cell division protein ZapB